MTGPDPRWLEILKASGWHTTALAVASALVLVLVKRQVIPTDGSPYWVALPIIGTILFGCLSVAAVARASVRMLDPMTVVGRWRRRTAQQRSVRAYMPHMTPRERQIIAYLLHHNQRVFQTEQDGGYAAPLISMGVIRTVGITGQVMDPRRVTFEIPDLVWRILDENRAMFPYDPSQEQGGAPWAIPWMAR